MDKIHLMVIIDFNEHSTSSSIKNFTLLTKAKIYNSDR